MPRRNIGKKTVPKRKSVLFVDDDMLVHSETREVASKIIVKHKHAFSPAQAERIIARRMNAILSLMRRFELRLSVEKDKTKMRELKRKMGVLKRMQKEPFHLVVSDVNMPRGKPTGIKFVGKVKEKFPDQKIIMFSDDHESMDHIFEKQGILGVTKLSFTRDRDLEEEIRRQLRKGTSKRKNNKA